MGRVAVAWRVPVYCGGDRSAWGCPRHTGLAHPTGTFGGEHSGCYRSLEPFPSLMFVVSWQVPHGRKRQPKPFWLKTKQNVSLWIEVFRKDVSIST